MTLPAATHLVPFVQVELGLGRDELASVVMVDRRGQHKRAVVLDGAFFLRTHHGLYLFPVRRSCLWPDAFLACGWVQEWSAFFGVQPSAALATGVYFVFCISLRGCQFSKIEFQKCFHCPHMIGAGCAD